MRFKQPLARQLLLGILCISSILTLIITAINLYTDYKYDLVRVDERLQQIEKTHLPSITNALWAEDSNQLALLLEGVHQLPGMLSVEIWQDNRQRLKVGKAQSKYTKVKSWPIVHQFNGEDYALGEFVVYTELESVYDHLQNKLVIVLLSQGTKTLIISLFIFVLVHLLVTRHINKLASHMARVNLTKPKPLMLDRNAVRDDEINRLANEYNTMCQALSDSFSEIVQQKRQIEQADRLKSDFLSNVSQEAKNPLNGLMGMTHLLTDTKLDHRQFSYLQVIKKSAFHLLELFNSVLDFSNIEQSKLNLNKHAFNLSETLAALYEQYKSKAKSKNIDLIVKVDPLLNQHVVGDSARLKQVLNILISNAIKYTNHGSVGVYLDAVADAGLANISFSVRDTGVGFPEEKQQAVFKKASLEDNTGTGTSLGITIAAKIVRIMGGELQLNSKVGLGSEFRFMLQMPLSGAISQPSIDTELKLNGKRALILDDNQFNAFYLSELFLDWHILTSHVQHPELALELMASEDEKLRGFDYVFLSNNSFNDNGIKIYEQINQIRFNKPPFLVLFDSHNDITELAAHIGFDAVWQLPKHPDDIRHALIDASTNSIVQEHNEQVLGCKVLIADDSEVSQRLCNAILSQIGVEVVFANDGEQAVEMWQLHRPNIILMDCVMPKLDGLSAAKKIRMLEPFDAEPVVIVAISSESDEEKMAECINVGMDEFLLKPYSPYELKRLVRKVIEKRMVNISN